MRGEGGRSNCRIYTPALEEDRALMNYYIALCTVVLRKYKFKNMNICIFIYVLIRSCNGCVYRGREEDPATRRNRSHQ